MSVCALNSISRRVTSCGRIRSALIGFEEAREIWTHPYYLDCRSDIPEQFRGIGWVKGDLYSVIFEVGEDAEGEYDHLITLWKATKEERKLYEENS